MTEVEDVHAIINDKATEVANLKLVSDPRVPPQYSRIYRPLPNGRLGLMFSPAFNNVGQPLLGILQQIARDAVRQVILENPKLIGGLMIGEARKGHNYFS
jgi:hypothetical protein